MQVPSSTPTFPALVHSNHVLNPTAISFNPVATSFVSGRQPLQGPTHIPFNQHNYNPLPLHGVYSLQPPTEPFSTSQSSYRPVFPPHLHTNTTTSMTTLPLLPQVSPANPTAVGSLLGPNSSPPVTENNRRYLHYTQVLPPHVSHNTTNPTGRPYFTNSIEHSLDSLTCNATSGWTITNTNSMQQVKLGNSNDPFGADQPGNLRPYRLGGE